MRKRQRAERKKRVCIQVLSCLSVSLCLSPLPLSYSYSLFLFSWKVFCKFCHLASSFWFAISSLHHVHSMCFISQRAQKLLICIIKIVFLRHLCLHVLSRAAEIVTEKRRESLGNYVQVRMAERSPDHCCEASHLVWLVPDITGLIKSAERLLRPSLQPSINRARHFIRCSCCALASHLCLKRRSKQSVIS